LGKTKKNQIRSQISGSRGHKITLGGALRKSGKRSGRCGGASFDYKEKKIRRRICRLYPFLDPLRRHSE
jgi:hypothetical protein